MIRKPLELRENFPGAVIFEELPTNLRLSGMDGHKQGREAHLVNALPFPLGQVGQGEITAIEKAEAIVVIF